MRPAPNGTTVTASVSAAVKLDAAAEPAREVDPEALPAALLDRYEILAPLGSGGMGAVYRARDRRLAREVALKILFPRGPGGAERALREARSQARLDHENACKVFEVGVSSGVCHIAMQYIAGEPLSVACARMTLEAQVRAVRDTARALHEAHRIGLVHRDVKPSNVMIEQLEDGSFKPTLMDFGIAREVGGEGLSATGSIAGTPAYMAPEQARGEIHALDRRTDVYGLGATLFDVLAGRPPFAAATAWSLLQQVIGEEAPALRSLRPALPADLEAIVARCLEKAPERRYDSARALGEDLQRFLDGDPVQARRPSLAHRLLRAARKHRALVTSAAATIAAALVVLGLGMRERRLAAERAELSRVLGGEVKEMELSLRIAFALPLHDVEQEKDLLRARLGGLEARIAAAGPAAEGPGRYALGRGYLTLQEPEAALAQLTRAEQAGYRAAELDYALGLALGELFTRALEETKRIDNAERKKARIEALKARYEAPALAHLHAALGARLDAPAYVEGLIALHEGRPEEALRKAREAKAARPWFYEASLLEGEAHFALGSRFGHDAAFDHARMMADFLPAAEAYAAAAEIARSDPRVHQAECALWAQMMNAASAHGEPLKPSYEKARAACRRAIAASSRSDRGQLTLAFLQVSFSWWITTGGSTEDPDAVLAETVSLAEEALRRSPGEPMAHYVIAAALRAEARFQSDRGLDSRATIDRSIAAYEQALRLDPTFLWARNDLAFACSIRAEDEVAHGRDPTAALEEALRHSREASKLDPTFLYARSAESVALLMMAEQRVDTGRDPASVLAPWREAIAAASALSRDWPWADYYLAYQAWLEARFALESGGDPGEALTRGAKLAQRFLERSHSPVDAGLVQGKLASTRALHLLKRGEDPAPALTEAREAFQRCVEAASWDLSLRVLQARAEIVGLRWTAKQGKLDAAAIQAAAAPLLPFLDRERADPRLYQTLAELREIEATSLFDKRKDAAKALEAGLSLSDQALTLDPRMPAALGTRQALHALKARAR